MHRLNDLAMKLTPEQVKEVEDFAEFLAEKNAIRRADQKPVYLNVDAIAGMCAGMGGDKTSVELVHEANDLRAAWAVRSHNVPPRHQLLDSGRASTILDRRGVGAFGGRSG